MKNTKLVICNTTIHPGEVANLALPLPEIYSCAPMYMPLKIIHGRKKGPCLLVFSSANGNEFNGMEIVNRIVQSMDPNKINGTVIAIPILNVYSLTRSTDLLPGGSHLEDCFPGKENGSFGERFAYLFTQEILKKANYCIELKTGALNHNILPQIYCNFDDNNSKKLAKAFQSPVVTDVNVEENLLRKTTEELHIPLLVYEAGEAMRFDENAIEVGVNGVTNVMSEIDIMKRESINEINPIFSHDEAWLIAPKGGILYPKVSLGEVVDKNQEIGSIVDPFGNDLDKKVKSHKKGIIVGINSSPLIHEGMSIFKITSFVDNDKAENIIEKWDEKQEDSFLN